MVPIRSYNMKKLFIFINVIFLCHIISAQRDVRLPPAITRWPQEKEIQYNRESQFTLECGAEGTPTVRYEWKRNGLEINANLSGIRMSSDGTITINRATEMDEGYYQCFAENQYGTALSKVVHVRMAFIDRSGLFNVPEKTVVEGMPFCMQADQPRSFPAPWYNWYIQDEINTDFVPLQFSSRIQVDDNGYLHFAYALPEDAAFRRVYRCRVFHFTSQWGKTTQLTVTNSTGNISQFGPTLAFSSGAQAAALAGKNLRLRCFFYGYPAPEISWSGPDKTNSAGRYSLSAFNSTLTINGVTESDEGNYSCTASNVQGNNTHTFQIRVEVEPSFRTADDGPYNVNVTEGDSITFNCIAFAKPEARIVWLQNGQPIDTNNPPKRFAFSNDLKSLTIRNVCRDCVDRKSKTDLMVIQCNASNIHGYVFTSGYLNVLMKTKATIRGSENVTVDFLEAKQFVFQCDVTSDPSTHHTVQWYKTEPFNDLVRDEPPYVYVTKDILVIMIVPKCTASDCSKYLGEYRCIGDSGSSRDNRTITLAYKYRPSTDTTTEESCAVLKIFLGIAAVILVLLLVGIFFLFRSRRHFVTTNRRAKGRSLPNPPSINQRIGYDSADLPLQKEGNRDQLMPRECNEYEHVGYDSIDQVLKEIAKREGAADVDEYHRYETVDAPQKEGKGSPILDGDNDYDDTGPSIPPVEVRNGQKENQRNISHYESRRNESGIFPKSDKQSDSTNTYSDLNRAVIDSNVDPEESDLNPMEMSLYWDPGSKKVNRLTTE